MDSIKVKFRDSLGRVAEIIWDEDDLPVVLVKPIAFRVMPVRGGNGFVVGEFFVNTNRREWLVSLYNPASDELAGRIEETWRCDPLPPLPPAFVSLARSILFFFALKARCT